MKKSILVPVVLLLSAISLLPSEVWAGPYSDEMAKCIVESTSDDEKNQFVKWMFSAVSAHPALSSISSISQNERDQLNRQTANMFVEILTEKCKNQTTKAIKYEGVQSLNIGFEILGKVAAQGMFNHPEVSKQASSIGKYVDKEKLKSVGIKE